MRTVEGVNVAAAVARRRPSRGLHRARTLQRQLVKPTLPWILRYPAFRHEPQEIAVRADVIEAMIVHADVADVRRHNCDCPLAADREELLVACGVELQNRGAELEALRP